MSQSKPTGSAQTALRLIRTLQLIPRHSANSQRKIGTGELLERLEQLGYSINLRSLQRDLKKLSEQFPGLRNDGNRDALGWYWEAGAELLDIPAMDPAMALSFKLAEKFLSPVMPAQIENLRPYLDAAQHSLGKRSTWLDRIHIEPRSMPLIPAAIDPAVLDTVHRALIEQKRLHARYHPRDGEAAEYELNPLGLVLRHEVTYLVATAWEFTDPRHYALHRFDGDHIQLLDTPARSPEGFDIKAYIRNASFQYQVNENPVSLEILIDRSVANHLIETPLSTNQTVEELHPQDKNWLRIKAQVSDTLQLRWWILGLGKNIIIEKPKSLSDDIKESLRSAFKNYIS